MNLELESVAELATASLAANEIERETGRREAHHGDCANCHTPLAGSFCHACGQRAHVHRSLLHFGEELAHGLLHFDAKGWRTLPLLVARPGKLTRDYIDGKRTRYVSPLALFLFMVFFMFFVVSSVSKSNIDGAKIKGSVSAPASRIESEIVKMKKDLADAETQLVAARASGQGVDDAESGIEAARASLKEEEDALRLVRTGAGKAGKVVEQAGKDEFSADTGFPRLDEAIRHAVQNPELTLYKLKNAASKYSFLLVPISLPFLWLMFFWKRGVTMYDHAVFSLYSLSFMALLVVVLALLKMAGMKPLVVAMIFFVPPIHMFLQLRGAYGLGLAGTLWRTAFLLFASATVFILYLLLILMLSMA
ncbi:DUF3667 domain-containing protein [Massilia sp. R2A-15]|uniref:DUF3667 domain-containing protein n=1 Tax=Massilia sp. R2A-15 TaxID=3064278 RepID=UPI002735F175|nr:DUF3667 domain-containing protein [Massilia sp. R2A-15]WLI89104.1 DUF3667 domain-containing protein [Massilia sp. R2A-15]